jgi:HK97 family phage portal protein/HK97 family phage prohead protease
VAFNWLTRALGFNSPVVERALGDAPTFAVDIPAEVFGIPSYSSPVAPVGKVTRAQALTVPAVSRARDMIAATIGTLPLDLLDSSKQTRQSSLLEQPEMGLTRVVSITRVVEDLFFDNVSYWLVKERDGYGFPSYVKRVDPCVVDVRADGSVWVDGKQVNEFDVIQFVGHHSSGLLTRGARAIRQALLLDDLARRFAENPQAREYFTPAEGADPADDADIAQVLTDWATARQAGITGYVPAALKLNEGNLINPRDLQLADARQHAVLELARLSGLDPEDLGVSVTSRTYQNLEQSRRERVTNVLQPYISVVEQRLSMNDVCPRGTYVRFNLDGFLRADTTSRYAAYTSALAGGFLTVNEVRELEDRQPLASNQGANVNQSSTVAASKDELAGQHFSDEPDLEVVLDAPASSAEFQVDLDKRTIRGLAVPYGASAEKMGRRWQFSKGTLKYDELSRVKLLDGHDWSKPIGVAVKAEDTDKGLVMTFKVPATPAGDEALLLASEKVKDGLSIGVGIGGTFDEKDGTLYAVSAPLAHVALTPCPAFDSARVTAVAASKNNEEKNMADKVDTPATETVAPQFTAEQVAALQALITPKQDEQPKPEPQKVAQFSVTEPLPYRFDGQRGEHEFSADLFSVAKRLPNAGEAQARLDKFMDVAFAVTSAGVADLNPPQTRADLFVDNLDYSYPVWNAINKGTLSDGTPFIAPKFNSASGLVADHTEGQSPSAGSYSATKQTITPEPVSGRVEIPREVVDAGGNPQVSGMIWREVVRAYYENLEAEAVALLDGLTPTSLVTLAAGDKDDVLAGKIEGALASLHFVRGGDRFDRLVLQEDLYKALIGARDADGRVLYPIIGATNANGQAAANLGQIVVGGKVGIPAWALGASGTAAESSYLFASEDVHGWATAPQRFDFEYRVEFVDLAVWGYKAVANTRLAGVREISYDPVA